MNAKAGPSATWAWCCTRRWRRHLGTRVLDGRAAAALALQSAQALGTPPNRIRATEASAEPGAGQRPAPGGRRAPTSPCSTWPWRPMAADHGRRLRPGLRQPGWRPPLAGAHERAAESGRFYLERTGRTPAGAIPVRRTGPAAARGRPGQPFKAEALPSATSLFGRAAARRSAAAARPARQGIPQRRARRALGGNPDPGRCLLFAGLQLADGTVLLVGAAGQVLQQPRPGPELCLQPPPAACWSRCCWAGRPRASGSTPASRA
jgi:hypothetical protein